MSMNKLWAAVLTGLLACSPGCRASPYPAPNRRNPLAGRPPTNLCDAGGGWALGGGTLRGGLSSPPSRTPFGDCGGDSATPPIYTFFLDVPCHESWKPVACC